MTSSDRTARVGRLRCVYVVGMWAALITSKGASGPVRPRAPVTGLLTSVEKSEKKEKTAKQEKKDKEEKD